MEFCRQAVANWKELSPVIMDGEQYRLVSPYDGNHAAVSYVSQDSRRAVLFAYDIHPRFQEKLMRVRLQGLDPDKTYTVRETNLMPGEKPSLKAEGKSFTGDYLMMRKAVFYAVKGHLLRCKRWPFTKCLYANRLFLWRFR